MIIVVTLSLSFVVALALIAPHLRPASAGSDATGLGVHSSDALEDQLSRCQQVLSDLELDYATQKVADDDYRRTHAALTRELTRLRENIARESADKPRCDNNRPATILTA